MAARRTDRHSFRTPYAFEPLGGVSLSVNTSSSSAALPTEGEQILITNTGTVTAHVALGVGSATATTSRLAILPQTSVIITRPQSNIEDSTTLANYIAAITASGSTTLQVETGAGF